MKIILDVNADRHLDDVRPAFFDVASPPPTPDGLKTAMTIFE